MNIITTLMSDVAGNNTVYTAKFATLQRTPDYIKITSVDVPSNTVTVIYYSDSTAATVLQSVPFVDAETVFFQVIIDA